MTKENETPDAVAEVDLQGAAALIALLKGAAGSLAEQANANTFGTSGERFNVDIGLDEIIKANLAAMDTSKATLKIASDHATASQELANSFLINIAGYDNNYAKFLAKLSAKDQNQLAEAFKWETDNEVLSTLALAKVVDNLGQRVDSMVAIVEALVEKVG
jgi:hypothetical protein